MAEYRVFAQLCPADVAENELYLVPQNKALIVSSITVCNITAGADKYSIAVQGGGGAAANENWVKHSIAIAADESVEVLKGITLEEDYRIIVQSNTADTITFNLFGTLIDQP